MDSMSIWPEKFPAKGLMKLLPGRCCACGKWPAHGLCVSCYGLLKTQKNRCYSCAIELPSPELSLCGYCLKKPFAFDATFAAVSYVSPWKELVQNFKFYQGTENAFLMAQMMYLSGCANTQPTSLPDALLPIPITASRMRERGYNQSWEIAKKLSILAQIPAYSQALQHTLRIFDAQASQTQRKRKERFRALKGAFFIPEKYNDMIKGKHIILVDDVMTTGATLHHAALALKKIGAKRVDGWVFARTPEQRTQA